MPEKIQFWTEFKNSILESRLLWKVQNFKVGLSLSKKLFYCFNESPLKMMKNVEKTVWFER